MQCSACEINRHGERAYPGAARDSRVAEIQRGEKALHCAAEVLFSCRVDSEIVHDITAIVQLHDNPHAATQAVRAQELCDVVVLPEESQNFNFRLPLASLILFDRFDGNCGVRSLALPEPAA